MASASGRLLLPATIFIVLAALATVWTRIEGHGDASCDSSMTRRF